MIPTCFCNSRLFHAASNKTFNKIQVHQFIMYKFLCARSIISNSCLHFNNMNEHKKSSNCFCCLFACWFFLPNEKKRTILWYNNNESNCYVGNLWSSKETTLDECWGWFVGGVVENFLMTYNKLKTERRKMFVKPSKKNSIRCQNYSDEIDCWWSPSN